MRLRGKRSSCLLEILLIAAWASSGVVPAFANEMHQFNVPAEPAPAAIRDFASQAKVEILVAGESVQTKRLHAVTGELSTAQGLKILLADSGLAPRYVGVRSIALVIAANQGISSSNMGRGGATGAQHGKEGKRSSSRGFRMAQVGGTASQDAAAVEQRSQEPPALQEVIVTGTHIRSAKDTVLPTQTFTREDIDQSGLGTVAAFLQTMPANFGGGVSEITDAGVAGGGQSAQNGTAGTGVNLRGLGDDATLVLLDGHRIAPAAILGNFVDLSMIPLTAVQRIDVVTDGASAIYGSDAVGGVVNIITREGFNDVETRARFGSDDHNDIHETELGQTVGREWTSGSALVSYEFYDRTPLSAADRSFTESAPLPFTLLPEQVRQSAFATLSQSIGPHISLYSDAYFSHRSTNSYDTILGAFKQFGRGGIDSYGAILGARLAVTDTTDLDISGDYSIGDANRQTFNLPQRMVANQKAKSSLATGGAVLSGVLWSLPAGSLSYALGVQYKRESFESQNFITHTQFEPSRDVSAGFAELRIPVLASTEESGRQAAKLELSLADREEHYSDFGSTNNSTFGLIWKPIGSLELRGTYGTSFVAPLLSETNPVPSEIAGFNTTQVAGSAPPGSGVVNELIVFGGNANLKPQTATTWTVGADWNSGRGVGPQVHVNYYNTRFTSRINTLQSAGYNVYLALPQATILGPQIVQLNPSSTLVQQLASSSNLQNFGANLSDIGAIIDARELNLSEVKTDGIDLSVADRVELSSMTVEPGIDATRVFHLDTNFTSSSPVAETLNTIYNPTRLRVRGHLLIVRQSVSVAAFVNFVNSYTNNTASPPAEIGSWMTFDVSATYSCEMCRAILPRFSATLAVLNLLNRDPPYAKNASGFAVNYDGANSNPLGRFISLDLTTRW